MIKKLSCLGYRGFSDKQSVDLAIPNGKLGSGLTVVIGPNGGGKSTIVECLQKLQKNDTSFTEGKRNKLAGDRIDISIQTESGQNSLKTKGQGGSEAIWDNAHRHKIYHLPARRVFSPFFSKNKWTREMFITNPAEQQFRTSINEQFTYRLFDALEDSIRFNEIFWRVLGKKIEWTIDQTDQGQYYIKIMKENGILHNSDGMGEGVVSLMFLCDAIFGASEDELIVIDEPELSLHPQLQNRLMLEIQRVSKTCQIVISTHSPQFVSLESVLNGGVIARVFQREGSSKICQTDNLCSKYFDSFLKDVNFPHSFGINAKMCLFSEDNLILTEGQEDVVLYPKLLENIGSDGNYSFWGFGAGGAEKIEKIAYILYKLGFSKIAAIFDGDKISAKDKFNSNFGQYGFKAWCIPANDIRDKGARPAVEKKNGILKNDFSVKAEYIDELKNIFSEINTFNSQRNG